MLRKYLQEDFLLPFIFSNAHNSFHCQVLIGLTKTISLHQGEHFFEIMLFEILLFRIEIQTFLGFSRLIGGQTPWRGRSTIS